MDTEKLIERVVGELYIDNMSSERARIILRAAFDEVRRAAIEEAANHIDCLGLEGPAQTIRELIPPAAEGVVT